MNAELRRARNRQMFIFLFVAVSMVLLLGRLYYWQIIEAHSDHNLAALANDEHIQNLTLNAPRGLIYDAQGHLLATNVVRDDVYIEPLQFWASYTPTELPPLIHSLHQVLPSIPEDRLDRAFHLNTQTYRIAGPIEPAQSEQLRALQLPDTFLQPRTWRTYPAGDLGSQVLGYVQDSKGIYGIERLYNKQLAGKPGSLTAETDLNGDPLTVGATVGQDAVKGADLTLTIDGTIQYDVQTQLAATVERLKAQSGAAIVVNTRTGAIVAMAGYPSFDPNSYGSYANTLGCLGDQAVYLNPALYCQYEPGSTMKAVTMAAALDQQLINPDTAFNDPGYIYFKDAPVVTNWEDRAYGHETMTQVLEHSANVGAAYVAHDILKPAGFYPYLQRFGFGQSYGIIGSQEASGYYRSPDAASWTPSDLTRQSFGQSILATPLQMAMAYAAIANGGVMMQPYLVSAVNNNGSVVQIQPQIRQRVISADAAHLLTGMLVHAAFDGNAKDATFDGYTIAAKTGTATTQGLSTDQTEASVAGFLPASDPQFAILVKLDRPQLNIYGAGAAPLWRTIAQQLMWHYNVPPDRPS